MAESFVKPPPPEYTHGKSAFLESLERRWDKGLFICVGLDPVVSKIPPSLMAQWNASEGMLTKFCTDIVDATAEFALAFKPNSAFFEEFGDVGFRELANVVRHIKTKYSDIPVIYDAKRGDIGNTNTGYAHAAFDLLQVDAMTVNPYLGNAVFDKGEWQNETLKPFLSRADKGILVLCKTSNPTSGEFQDLPVNLTGLNNEYVERYGDLEELREMVGSDSIPLYQIVAYRATRHWNKLGNVGLVVGATYPKELGPVREIAGNETPILIPGVGTQGGDLEASVREGINIKGNGIIINVSSGILYASKGEDYAQAAQNATAVLTHRVNRVRNA